MMGEFTVEKAPMEALARQAIATLSGRLRRRGWKLAVAESCTGGLLGHWITQVSGSSAYFLGGVIAYANELKRDLLNVPQATLERYGAVSAPTAAAMAQGVRHLTGAEVGVAITGIAGPSGGTPQKPVGTVYLAVAIGGTTWVWREQWPQGNSRSENKQQSALAALDHLLQVM